MVTKKKTKPINVSFRTTSEIKKIIEKMAKVEQRSQAQIMEFALKDYAKKLKVTQ